MVDYSFLEAEDSSYILQEDGSKINLDGYVDFKSVRIFGNIQASFDNKPVRLLANLYKDYDSHLGGDYAAIRVLGEIVPAIINVDSKPVRILGSVANLYDSLDFSASYVGETSDGYIKSISALSWSDAQAAVSGAVYSSDENVVNTIQAFDGGDNWSIRRTFLSFDTSDLPDDAAIYGITLKAYGYGASVNITAVVQKGTQADILVGESFSLSAGLNSNKLFATPIMIKKDDLLAYYDNTGGIRVDDLSGGETYKAGNITSDSAKSGWTAFPYKFSILGYIKPLAGGFSGGQPWIF